MCLIICPYNLLVCLCCFSYRAGKIASVQALKYFGVLFYECSIKHYICSTYAFLLERLDKV